MAELPSGTVTFLFTDLEGSTRLWEEHPEAMRASLARHDELLRGAIESHAGHVVKTTGDGFHAAFATAHDALEAALAAQLALTAERWTATGPLWVRMGMHTGEAEYRDGDYYGTALNRAARVAGAAHGGQLLVSRATMELLGDGLPEGCYLLDLGEHRLRDLGRPETLLQLGHPDLPRSFPPPRSLDAYPGNLPAQFTSFVGRTEEMQRIEGALEEARLVTLTGVGGVGKTRLALQAAGALLPHFRDGAWFCELATAGDAEALVQVVATVLGVQPHPSVPLDRRVVDALRDRRALVLLDNCEHLLEAATRVAEGILRECAHVRLIATSREPLDVEGERIVRVRSLPFPEAGAEAAATDAVRLFIERARGVESDFDADDDETRTVGEICRRLDGIPLAIELAAARIVAMTPTEIAELLDERFRLLTGGRRTAVERHQTLRATVDWSYSLLEPNERLVFDRLGVFPGSFDASAARAVTGGQAVEDWDVRDALTGLVNKSMINTLSGGPGSTRYQLLETMRQYARERLDQTGDADSRRHAHAEHYAQLADNVGLAMLTGESIDHWRSTAQSDLDNYRAAVTWALDSDAPGDADLALRIAVSLAGIDPGTRRAAGLIAQSDRLLERAAASARELRAGVLAGMANDALMLRGDLEGAAAYAQRALAEGPVAGGLAFSYATLAICALAHEEFDRAHEILAEGQRATGSLRGEVAHWQAYFEMLLATVEGARGDQIATKRHAREAVRLARASEFPFRLAQALGTLARALRYDDPDGAGRAADEALHSARQRPDMGGVGNALMTQANLAALAGAPREAIGLFRDATLAWDDVVPPMMLVGSAARACRILADLDEPRAAALLGGAASSGCYSHLLFATVDKRGRDDLECTLEQLQERLGADVYELDAARGAAMSSDEILHFMRSTAARVLDASGP